MIKIELQLKLAVKHLAMYKCHGTDEASFFNFLVYGFFCPDWTVGGRNKNLKKIGVVYL